MSDEIPRSGYNITPYAERRMNERNIGRYEIGQAIEEGEIERTPEDFRDSDYRFRLVYPGVDLFVAVDSEDRMVLSVFYADEQGAEEGRI